MNRTNIAFGLPPEEAQSLHDFLIANGVLCPGPRFSEKNGMSQIIAVNRGTEADVRRAEAVAKAWRDSRNT